MTAGTPASTVFMFSGLGSHYYQMGRDLLRRHAGFRRCMEAMDEVVQDLSGESVIGTLYDPVRRKSERFDSLLSTSAALFMVEFALGSAFVESGVVPDYVLGASLGSWAAAAIAGCLTPEEALQLIVRQSRIVQDCCESGGLIVALDSPASLERSILASHGELAATSLPAHVTIAAPERNLEPIEQYLLGRDITFQRLAVQYPFHSKWIDGARSHIRKLGGSFEFRAPRIPLVCCAGARVVSEITPDHVWMIVREPIRLWDTIVLLERSGPHRYLDLGPSASMATLLKHGLPSGSRSSVQATLSPLGDNWSALQPLHGPATRAALE